jgi:hypothetical protein
MRKLCLAVLAGSLTLWGGDLFPLQEGNRWTYASNRGSAFTVQVGAPVNQGDVTYLPLTGYTQQPVLARINDARDVVYLDEASGAEVVLISFAPSADSWWKTSGRMCTDEGQTQGDRVNYSGPAGAFSDALEIRYRSTSCNDAGTTGEQFADNIGMVRRVNTSFAGPVTYDLVQARVGSQTIDTATNGSFTVIVQNSGAGNALAVTLRLTTRPTTPLKLSFSSGQEYDIVMKDSNGKSVYTWSASRTFIESLHDRIVEGSWETTVQIPRPDAAGAYTVEGWLTTSNGPRFAATVPVSIDPPSAP